MASRRKRASTQRATQFEQLEARQVMSAQPLGDFQIEYLADDGTQISAVADSFASGDLNQFLSNAHAQSGVASARSTYGFTGSGQTVAVIDSGIAYDHYALGGGLGAGYQVVGGWDFSTENDADPYDDGFAGSHGTHVAGIIGSNDATHSGVAPDVDLVGLRVFNDFGAGYFEWVEDALQWIHDNRNAFENPITTVNLSLGGSWNSDSLPNWAILEEEFAQLEQDGIFIAVAAGNSYASYGEPGLGYPAASPHVVPVSSVDDSGALSYFSQRHDRVLAAPGSGIISTIPDYKGNNNGVADDFASYSGTSMASPYVAGTSVLVRQAMEFVGYDNITQDTIYDHLRETADRVYDAATNAYYHRINVQAAIDALMPTDDFGSSSSAAHSLGNLTAGSSLSGLIGTTTDADFFTFTAGQTGQLQLTFSTTHDLSLNAQIVAGNGAFRNNTLTMDVVAGHVYIFSLKTSAGIGYYDADVSFQTTGGGSDSGSGDSESGSGSDGTRGGGENDSNSRNDGGSGASSVEQEAYELDQAKQLNYTGSDHLNWGGKNEKWLKGNDGWYFVLSDGQVSKWAGTGGANGTLVATLDGSYYHDLSKLYDAQPPGDDDGSSNGADSGNTDSGNADAGAGGDSAGGDTDNGNDSSGSGSGGGSGGGSDSDTGTDRFAKARKLDSQFGFYSNGSYHDNWAGLGEKWIQSDVLGWVFITSDGSIHDWNGSLAGAAASTLVDTLDASFHTDPSLLTDPPAAESGAGNDNTDGSDGNQGDSGSDQDSGGDTGNDSGSEAGDANDVARRAYELDQQLGLKYGGGYYPNWVGAGEKWISSNGGQWYFITGNGSLYRWNGSRSNAMASTLVATLDATYHADPSKLHDAPKPTGANQVADRSTTNQDSSSAATAASFDYLQSVTVAGGDMISAAHSATQSSGGNGVQRTTTSHQNQTAAAVQQFTTQVTFTSVVSSDGVLIDSESLAGEQQPDLGTEIDAVDSVFEALDDLTHLAKF